MNEKILITGSAGFIGNNLTKYLDSHGYNTLGIDLNTPDTPQNYLKCDILDIEKLSYIFSSYSPNVVVHLAARIDLDEKQDINGYSANIQGTRNIIEAIKFSGSVRRALFTSSQLVCKIGYLPKDDSDYCPDSLYGRSKMLTEKLVRESEMTDITWCILRPTTIWGEGMSAHYRRFLKMIKNGHYFHVGNRELYKSFGYIGNVVHQYTSFIKAPRDLIHGKTFYVADYNPLSLQGWVDGLATELGAPKVKSMPLPLAHVLAGMGNLLNKAGLTQFPFNTFRLNNILTEYIFDLAITEKVCGPVPFSVKEGIERTVNWFNTLDNITANNN